MMVLPFFFVYGFFLSLFWGGGGLALALDWLTPQVVCGSGIGVGVLIWLRSDMALIRQRYKGIPSVFWTGQDKTGFDQAGKTEPS